MQAQRTRRAAPGAFTAAALALGTSASAQGRFIASEIDRLGAIVKAANLRAD